MVESNGHLNRQYLVVKADRPMNSDLLSSFETEVPWHGYQVFTGTSLQATRVYAGKLSLLLLGYAVHHEHHELGDEQLLSLILSKSRDCEDVIRRLNDCGGRYVALIADEVRTVAVTDSCAFRQLYWFNDGARTVLSSSPRLILDALGLKPELDQKTASLLNDPTFIATESAWYGDRWYDNRINKVIANHCLDLKTCGVCRMDYCYDGPTAYADILSYAATVLSGLMSAVHSRYNIIQALTSGYDSRLLLAASRKHCDRTRYYLFDSSYDLKGSPDVKIAAALCKKLGLNFEVIMPRTLSDDFLAEYRKKCFFPRILYSTAHIQWHYDFNRNRQILNINGNCGEIARYFYQNKVVNRESAGPLVKIAGLDGFFEPQISSWYPDAVEYCRANRIDIYDLFYWEQRMSNWGAMYRFEQDIAIEEFTPYNHKNLLLALLHVDLSKRKAPSYVLFNDLIHQLWQETLALPFNPIVGVQLKARAKKVAKLILGKK